MFSLLKKTTLALFTTAAVVYASPPPEPGKFSFGGELIYFQPLVEDSFFSIRNENPLSPVSPIGSRLRNEFDWQAGFRLDGIYSFCNSCTDLKLRWTRLHSQGKTHEETPFSNLMQTQGVPGGIGSGIFVSEASSNLDLTYNAIDALLEYWFWDTCESDYNCCIQYGLHYASIKYKQNVNYTSFVSPFTVLQSIRNKDLSYGIGPELGIEMNYKLPQFWNWTCYPDISLRGSFLTALVVTSSKPSFYNDSFIYATETLANVKNECEWRVVPMGNLRLGFGYTQDFCDSLKADLEIGYEILTYYRGLHSIRFYDHMSSGLSKEEYTNLGFHGPYVALNIRF